MTTAITAEERQEALEDEAVHIMQGAYRVYRSRNGCSTFTVHEPPPETRYPVWVAVEDKPAAAVDGTYRVWLKYRVGNPLGQNGIPYGATLLECTWDCHCTYEDRDPWCRAHCGSGDVA